MRLDKYLKVSRLIKRRTVANEACDAGRVMINDRPAKASAEVKAGDKVKTGQTIGRVDTINGDTQLHFEVWKGTKPQNPEGWLK